MKVLIHHHSSDEKAVEDFKENLLPYEYDGLIELVSPSEGPQIVVAMCSPRYVADKTLQLECAIFRAMQRAGKLRLIPAMAKPCPLPDHLAPLAPFRSKDWSGAAAELAHICRVISPL